MSDHHTNTEEFQVNGEQLVARIKEILHQGNIRRLIIKDKEGRTLIEVPVDDRRGGRTARPGLGSHRRNCRAGGRGDHRRRKGGRVVPKGLHRHCEEGGVRPPDEAICCDGKWVMIDFDLEDQAPPRHSQSADTDICLAPCK